MGAILEGPVFSWLSPLLHLVHTEHPLLCPATGRNPLVCSVVGSGRWEAQDGLRDDVGGRVWRPGLQLWLGHKPVWPWHRGLPTQSHSFPSVRRELKQPVFQTAGCEPAANREVSLDGHSQQNAKENSKQSWAWNGVEGKARKGKSTSHLT